MIGPKTSVCVTYKNTEGMHVFMSDDLPGLYIASQDAQVAYNDISVAIETLLKLNQNIRVKAEPELSFAEFIKAVSSTEGKAEQRPLVLASQRYTVYSTQ